MNDQINHHDVVVYVRSECACSESAIEVLEQQGVKPSVVGGEDAQITFGEDLPVVVINGKVRFRRAVDPVLLRRIFKPRADGARSA